MTILDVTDPRALDAAVTSLEAGRPVVVPTDTVYGLAARVDDHAAVRTIFEWKARPDAQVMAVLVCSFDQAWALAEATPLARALAAEWWPGPLTIVLEQRAGLDLALGPPSPTVGVRWPESAFVADLAQRVGPLTTTSANRHGEPTPSEAQQVVAQLGRPDVLVIDGGLIDGQASTVVDATGPDPQVLRVGPVSASAIAAVARRA